MHELSIAISIIDVAGEELARQADGWRGGRVESIRLKLGPLSGVVETALQNAWELAREGSPLADAKLVIESVPIEIDCAICKSIQPVVSMQEMKCARCGTPSNNVVRGRELQVVAMEIYDEQASLG